MRLPLADIIKEIISASGPQILGNSTDKFLSTISKSK
jgi:hypothetical protein